MLGVMWISSYILIVCAFDYFVRDAAAEKTYLSAQDDWHVTYISTSSGRCSERGVSSFDTAAELLATIKLEYHCNYKLEIVAVQNATYPGAFKDTNNLTVVVTAVGESTAKKIFGIPSDKWWMKFEPNGSINTCFSRLIGMKAGVDSKFLDKDYRLKRSSIIVLSQLNEPESYAVPKEIKGAFEFYQLAEPPNETLPTTVSTSTPEPCANVATGFKLTFITTISRPLSYSGDKNLWLYGGYMVIPLCIGVNTNENCYGAHTPDEVRGCIANLQKENPSCAIRISIFWYQRGLNRGLAYGKNGSTTFGVSMSHTILSTFLADFGPRGEWMLDEVFIGGEPEQIDAPCFSGDMAYKNQDIQSSPTATHPLNFEDWKVHMTYTPLYGSSALYRPTLPQVLSTKLDLQVALKQQQGSKCDWFSTTTELSFVYIIGKPLDFIALKNSWNVTYKCFPPVHTSCNHPKFNAHSYEGPDRSRVAQCVKSIRALNADCEVNVDVVLEQTVGHEGIFTTEGGDRNYALAISKEITKDVFVSPVPNYPFLYLREVSFRGHFTECDDIPASLSLSYKFKNQIETNPKASHALNKFEDVRRSGHIHEAILDPEKDFELVAEYDTPVCQVAQRGVSLTFTVNVNTENQNLTTCQNEFYYDYGLSHGLECAAESCDEHIYPTLEGVKHCIEKLRLNHLNCTSRINLSVSQKRCYFKAIRDGEGSYGAFAVGNETIKLLKEELKLLPYISSAISFGGNFFDSGRCLMKDAKLIVLNGTDALVPDRSKGSSLNRVYDYEYDQYETNSTYVPQYPSTIVIIPPFKNCTFGYTSGVLSYRTAYLDLNSLFK